MRSPFSRNPSLQQELMRAAILGFALTEWKIIILIEIQIFRFSLIIYKVRDRILQRLLYITVEWRFLCLYFNLILIV